MNKLCLFCKYFYLDGGSPHYSHLTPGESASIFCNKNHWRIDVYDSEHDFRKFMTKAETCSDYEESDFYKENYGNQSK